MENKQEPARKRMTGNERESFLRLMTAADILHKERDALAGRMKMIPNGSRDYGLIAAKTQKLFEALLTTIPLEQLLTFQRNLPYTVYSVGTKNVGGKHDSEFGMWISFDALNAIIDSLHDHCMLCTLDIQDQRKCPLAKAFDTLPVSKDEDSRGCGYFGRV